MVGLKRRKDDLNWVKNHHLLVTFIGIFIGLTAYIFTTFATVKYVDSEVSSVSRTVIEQHKETRQSIDDLRQEIRENRRSIFDLFRKKP